MICLACNNTKSRDVEQTLDGDTLDMFNFVCCLDLSQPEDSQGICSFCIEELKVSFNFKKRCLEIFANVFDNPNHDGKEQNEEDDGMDFMDSILDQSLHEEDASINLNDLLIPEVCLGNTALSALDITDQSKCRYCFKEFSSKEECQEHLEHHKGDDKPYKCPHDGCDSRFKARKNLKDHYLVHSNERPFPCHFCAQTFKSSSNRSKHERRIHTKERNAMKAAEAQEGLKKLEVKIGNELEKQTIVRANNSLVRNVQNSSTRYKEVDPLDSGGYFNDDDDRIYACDHEGCIRSFRTRSSLRDHQKVHSDDRPYICNFCSSAFKSSSNRSKHERSSHSVQFEKRKMEREAGKFKDSSTTNDEVPSKKMKIDSTPIESIMIQSHNTSINSLPSPSTTKNSSQNRTNFPCRYCDRLFKQTDSRDRHEATHKDFLAYDCGYCNKNFKSQELLKEHMKIHIEQTEFQCTYPNCNETFQDRRSLREHKNSHDPEEFICEQETCGKIFYSSKALKNHKKHTKHYVSTNDNNDNNQEADIIECEICEVKFNSDKIAEHLRLHI